MARSADEITNAALQICGAKKQIGSMGDGSAEANAAALLYPVARDGMLSESQWAFATRRRTLTARTEIVDGEEEYITRTNWAYSFALPDDFLHVQNVEIPGLRTPDAKARIPFKIEAGDNGIGLVLLCDLLEPELVYTCKLNDVASYPPLFTEALIWKLAAMLTLPLQINPAYAKGLEDIANRALFKAIASDHRQEQEDPVPDSEFITVRY